MPTGYTAGIEKGITFVEYAMGCARAFGALIMMRDDPADAPIPDEFHPSDYSVKALNAAQEKLARLKAMSDAEACAAADVDYSAALAAQEASIAKANALRAKYEAMLRHVRAWTPPSADHVEMKSFMEKQIVDSIEWDCSTKYYLENAPKLLTGREWRDREIQECMRQIDYHTREDAKERERASGRSLWVKQLKQSLGLSNKQHEVRDE